MFVYTIPPELTPVLSAPVSAVAAVVRDDGIVLAADRAVVGVDLDGKLTMLPDAPKLFAGQAAAVAMAGHAAYSAGDELVDLRVLVAQATDAASSPGGVAAIVHDIFSAHSALVRAVAEPFPVPDADVEALTIALVTGVGPAGLELWVACLTESGPGFSQTVRSTSVALAPPGVRDLLAGAAEEAQRAATLDAAVDVLAEGFLACSTADPILVSGDIDIDIDIDVDVDVDVDIAVLRARHAPNISELKPRWDVTIVLEV